MDSVDEAIHSAIKEADLLSKRTRKGKGKQVRGSERDVVRATALAWFNNHRKRLTTVLADADLMDVDQLYQQVLEASHRDSARSKYVETLKQIARQLAHLRSENILKLSCSGVRGSDEQPPDFSPLIQDEEMKGILQRRWSECATCVAAKAPLAAVVMMGGLLEGLLLAKVNSQTNKAPIFTAVAAPKDKHNKPLPLKEWKLQNFISVAHELGWITQTLRDIGQVLRDYRNYIHPQKEYSEKVSVTPDDAKLLWDISKSVSRQVL